MIRPLALFLVVAFALPAAAALPLEAIRAYQKKSPEFADLTVTKFVKKPTKKQGAHYFEITVEAEIIKVHRSKSGLEKGSKISITYGRPNLKKSPSAGDWAPDLKKGVTYQAYLQAENAEKKHFRPSASSGSFAALEAKSE